MWRVFTIIGCISERCDLWNGGKSARAEHRTPLFFLSVSVHRSALGWRARIWVPYPPLVLDQKGCPGICHENHMDLRQRPTYKSDHPKTFQGTDVLAQRLRGEISH